MVVALQRAKIRDTGIAAFILFVFAVLPFILVVTDRARINSSTLRIAYATCLGLSWPLLLAGGFPLLYYWRKGHKLNDPFVSEPTTAQLTAILIAIVTVACGCVMLIVAESIGLVGLIDTGWRWISFLDIVAIILLVWIVVLVMKTAAEVWGVRKQLVQATLGDTNSRPHTNKNSASSDV